MSPVFWVGVGDVLLESCESCQEGGDGDGGEGGGGWGGDGWVCGGEDAGGEDFGCPDKRADGAPHQEDPEEGEDVGAGGFIFLRMGF